MTPRNIRGRALGELLIRTWIILGQKHGGDSEAKKVRKV